MQTTAKPKGNRKYKDRLFRLLFSDKQSLLELYNALNQTSYTNPDDLEITTLDDVLYMKMKNDVSILLDDYLSLYEHQSTFNPNMPLRGLLYFADLYRQLFGMRNRRFMLLHFLLSSAIKVTITTVNIIVHCAGQYSKK